MDAFLLILSAACLAWGLGAAAFVAAVDEHHPIEATRDAFRATRAFRRTAGAFLRTHWSHR